MDAIFGPRHLLPRADAIATHCGVGQGWWYSTKLQRQANAIGGALTVHGGKLRGGVRVVFPRPVLHTMLCVAETPDRRVGAVRVDPDGTVLALPTPRGDT